MRKTDLFWKCIATDIAKEDKIKKGHPLDWKKKDILNFLGYFEERLVYKCQKNPSIAKKIKFIKIEKNVYNSSVIGFDAFRRIFITEETNSTLTTQNQFAIYFGYDSVEDYIEKKGINLYGTIPPIPDYLGNPAPESPYLGLQTYTLETCRLFHGRKNDLLFLINYLEERQEPCKNSTDFKDLIFLTGQTGVGKSSLLHAGLISRLFENWEISYFRRSIEKSLPDQFKEALKVKSGLLVIDYLELAFRTEKRDLPLYFQEFSNYIISIWKRLLEYPTSIILACNFSYIDKIEELLLATNLKNELVVLKQKYDSTIDLIETILKILDSSKSQIILIPSQGERHNLWKNLSPHLGNKRRLYYRFLTEENDSLEEILKTVEQKRKKLIILDQVEEAITKPNPNYISPNSLSNESSELKILAKEIHSFLERSKSKIIISYRTDFGEQIVENFKDILKNQYIKRLIKPLNKQEVKEAIQGPLKDNYFQLTYFEGFVEQIAYELKKDKHSNIAPALQILLKELWDVCQQTRHISEELFNKKVGKKMGILESFLQQQLKKLESELS